MKAKSIIITLLILAQIGAFALKANAQDSNLSDTILLADETTLNYTKTEAKIHCSNETVFNSIFKSHGALFKRFTCTWKTDRYGRYKDYVIYLNKNDAQLIVKWSKTNL